MGIKTRFNPMGGINGSAENLDEWRYSVGFDGIITLYEYLGQDTAIKVPKKNTVINGFNVYANSTPFYKNQNIVSVDLQNVPYVNNNMEQAFYNSPMLRQVDNINDDVLLMYSTFSECPNFNQNIRIPDNVQYIDYIFFNCKNFNQNIQIPNSVTYMPYAFANCSNFNQNIQIPNSVTYMPYAFANCSNFNQNVQIPDSVVNINFTFSGCTSLNQNIQIPYGVTHMLGTFSYCYYLNQNIQIPNSVTHMFGTFSYCYYLNQNIQIPNSVTNMINTFKFCYNLESYITIRSANVFNAANCFLASRNEKTVIFPSRYINNVNTATRNSFVSAGYAVGTCVGNLVNNTARDAVFYAYDPIAWEGYNQWAGNGTYWILNKWAGIGNGSGKTAITVLNSITSYETYPTAIVATTCFTGNTAITSVNCNNAPFAGTTCVNAFRNCHNLTNVINLNIPEGATTVYAMLHNCQNLTRVNSIYMDNAYLNIPNTVTNCQATFGYLKRIGNIYINGYGVTTMAGCFDYANGCDMNIYINSPKVTNITNMFRGNVNSYRKNLYIYFQYANGVNTATYNSFKAGNLYKGTSGNAAGTNPMYNSTSNFYVYNKGVCPI